MRTEKGHDNQTHGPALHSYFLDLFYNFEICFNCPTNNPKTNSQKQILPAYEKIHTLFQVIINNYSQPLNFRHGFNYTSWFSSSRR